MITPSPTRVPEVVDAILALCETIPNVTVLDGPVSAAPRSDVIAVGAGDESVVCGYSKSGAYDGSMIETLEVICGLGSWSGSTDMRARRNRAAEILTAIDAGIRADPTLGGVCDNATLGPDMTWKFENDEGALALLGFSISVKTNI